MHISGEFSLQLYLLDPQQFSVADTTQFSLTVIHLTAAKSRPRQLK